MEKGREWRRRGGGGGEGMEEERGWKRGGDGGGEGMEERREDGERKMEVKQNEEGKKKEGTLKGRK